MEVGLLRRAPDALRMVTRQRCSECGSWFTPSLRARSTQRVCGTECRAGRDRKLARARRRREIGDYRADECERKRASRAGVKARAAAKGAPCHAPPSAPKSPKLPEEIVQFLDRAIEASRATLQRDLSRNWPRLCEKMAKTGDVSRASAGGQALDSTAKSSPILAERHA
jgi:hypothetical protein